METRYLNHRFSKHLPPRQSQFGLYIGCNLAFDSVAEPFEFGIQIAITDVRVGFAADAPFIETPRDARQHYRKRFSIESSYRLAKQSLALTGSRDVGFRLLLFVVSLLLQNIWRYLHYICVAAPLRRGCHLLGWSFVEFCQMVLRAAWTALGVRRDVPANQPLNSRFFW